MKDRYSTEMAHDYVALNIFGCAPKQSGMATQKERKQDTTSQTQRQMKSEE